MAWKIPATLLRFILTENKAQEGGQIALTDTVTTDKTIYYVLTGRLT